MISVNKKNLLDIESMEKQIEKNHIEQSKQFHNRLDKMRDHEEAEQQTMNNLLLSVLDSERKENEKRKAQSVDKECNQAIAKVESQYESVGIKSEQSKQLDRSYSNLLAGLRLDDK